MMKKKEWIKLCVSLVAIAISIFVLYRIEVHGNELPMVDCTRWDMIMSPGPIYFLEQGVVRLQSEDLRVAKYRNPERQWQTCDRFFLENTGQTLWQFIRDFNYRGDTIAVLIGDTYVVREHIMYYQGVVKKQTLDPTGTFVEFVEFEVAMFEDSTSPAAINHTFTVKVIDRKRPPFQST